MDLYLSLSAYGGASTRQALTVFAEAGVQKVELAIGVKPDADASIAIQTFRQQGMQFRAHHAFVWESRHRPFNIDATQDMKFSVTSFDVPKSCAKFTVSLNNTSSYGKEVMAHNLVITKSSDRQAVSNAEGVNEASNYLKPNDERVVAATNLIGGGEKASVTFDVSKLDAGSDYVYFCSYPGHAMRLRGIIKVI